MTKHEGPHSSFVLRHSLDIRHSTLVIRPMAVLGRLRGVAENIGPGVACQKRIRNLTFGAGAENSRRSMILPILPKLPTEMPTVRALPRARSASKDENTGRASGTCSLSIGVFLVNRRILPFFGLIVALGFAVSSRAPAVADTPTPKNPPKSSTADTTAAAKPAADHTPNSPKEDADAIAADKRLADATRYLASPPLGRARAGNARPRNGRRLSSPASSRKSA